MAEVNTQKMDILNRNEFINNIIQITKLISSNKGNITFAINGEWGCGKTFVLNEIEDRLNQDKDFKNLVIPYNCWQYDYYEEPLVAIISTLLDCLKKSKKVSLKKREKIIVAAKQLGRTALSLGTHYVESKTKINLGTETEVIKEIVEGIDEALAIDDKAYDTHFELKDSLEKLRRHFLNCRKKKLLFYVLMNSIDVCPSMR